MLNATEIQCHQTQKPLRQELLYYSNDDLWLSIQNRVIMDICHKNILLQQMAGIFCFFVAQREKKKEQEPWNEAIDEKGLFTRIIID